MASSIARKPRRAPPSQRPLQTADATSGGPVPSELIARVVVPIEGTDREYIAQQWAVAMAAALGRPVLAVHVGTPSREIEAELFVFVRQACARWNVLLSTAIVEDHGVADTLAGLLGARDLVIIGTRSLGTQYHVGSVAGELVRRAPCPVQIVRIE